MLIAQEILHCAQQESAETAALAIGMGQPSLLDQLGEEALGEVTRAVRIVTAATHVGIERRPVLLAEPLECNRSLVGEHITRADHHAPVGRGENGLATKFGWEL